MKQRWINGNSLYSVHAEHVCIHVYITCLQSREPACVYMPLCFTFRYEWHVKCWPMKKEGTVTVIEINECGVCITHSIFFTSALSLACMTSWRFA